MAIASVDNHNDQVRTLNLALRKGWKTTQIKSHIKDIKEQGVFFNPEDVMTDKQKRAESMN